MTRPDDGLLLAAGGLLPGDAPAPEGHPVDLVDARRYSHPALGTRPVVRLCAQKLAPGDDLEMEFLGFEAPEVRPGVAKRRRQPLGFPGWALVHDPEHARFALEVVKELKRALRRARSKPGHTADEVTALGARLERAVPHFLPSFYEEVARGFVEVGNVQYAGRFFSKAREAERVHALDVDEQHRREAFLELALSGALTNKALEEYARDLAKAREPGEAYAHFRELCLKRTLGGMPPWAGMAKELRRLAKAAGKDADAEERAMLEAIVDAPSLKQASHAFWKAYRKPLTALCRASAAARGVLLNLFPEVALGPWLALLDEWGVLAALSHDGPEEAGPTGGPVAWMARATEAGHGDWHNLVLPDRLFSLMRETGERLRADGTPLQISPTRWRAQFDVDLAELALELGVPLAPPAEYESIDLEKWAKGKGPERQRDPVRVAADPRFAKLFQNAFDQAVGTEPFESVAHGKAGLAALKRAWLDKWIGLLDGGGLVDLEEALARLERSTDVRIFAEHPEAFADLGSKRATASLARTLRGGLFDEFGWPALEQAVKQLDTSSDNPLQCAGAFPNLILSTPVKALVLAADGSVVLEHDLHIPKGGELVDLRFSEGQLLVVYRDQSRERSGYWSSNPRQTFKIEGWAHGSPMASGVSVTLPDGSVTEGGKAFRPGDTILPPREDFSSDGSTFWRVDTEFSPGEGARVRLREFDPATGKAGRHSLPSFFEDYVADGTRLELYVSHLYPVPAEASASPLGVRDGLAGLRVRSRGMAADRRFEIEGIDGRTCSSARVPAALLRFPGSDTACLVSHERRGWSDSYTTSSADGSCKLSKVWDYRYRRGTPLVPSLPFWHLLVPRDPEASAALRSISDASAETLLAAALDDSASIAKAVSAELDIRHAALLEGVAGVIAHAGTLQQSLEKLIASRDPGRTGQRSVDPGVALGLKADLDWFLARNDYFFGRPVADIGRATAAAAVVSRWLTTGETAPVPHAVTDWPLLLGRISALAFRAIAAGTMDENRGPLLQFLEAWSRLVFARGEHPLRTFRAKCPRAKLPFESSVSKRDTNGYMSDITGFGEHDGSRYYFSGESWDPDHEIDFTFIEYAMNDVFSAPPGLAIKKERKGREVLSGEMIAHLVALARERGPLPLDPAVVDELMRRTGIGRAEAGLLWSGFPEALTARATQLKWLREALGVKARELDGALDVVKELGPEKLCKILARGIPDDLEQLWNPLGDGPDDDTSAVARLAAAWNAQVGRRTPMPAELVTELDRLLPNVGAVKMLDAVLDPDAALLMQEHLFGGAVLVSGVEYVGFLFGELPVGDSIRAALPRFVEALRAKLALDKLLLPLASSYIEKEQQQAVLDLVGGKELSGKKSGRDNGKLVARATTWSIELFFRPARVESYPDPEIERVAAAIGTIAPPSYGAALALASDGMAALVDRLQNTPLPAGSWEANPAVSAPALVAEVEKKLDISHDAAVLYLQILALANPTTKAMTRFNGWTSARVRKTGRELAKRKLVIEAKRSRAGRSFFAPGAWEALKAPHPPIETWKAELYGATRLPAGGLAIPLEHIVPLEPLHSLFERAWRRVESGDVPAYEEVK